MNYYKTINGMKIPVSKKTKIMLDLSISEKMKRAMMVSYPTQKHVDDIAKNAYRSVSKSVSKVF